MTNTILTGSNGFLGQHLQAKFKQIGVDYYPVPSKAYDLRRQAHIDALFKHAGPVNTLYHLAAHVGGIEYNINHPATLYYDNVMMNTQLIHTAALRGVKKFVFVSSVCIYGNTKTETIREHMIWWDKPEESNLTYGLSKRIALEQLRAYKVQYGMDFGYPILCNLYGPGDDFSNDKSHVIPALIKRFTVHPETVTIWGTGKPTRDFLYVKDAADLLTKYLTIDCDKPVNISSGLSIRISNLVRLISEITQYQGTIVYDHTKPDGQMNRIYDAKPAKQLLGWQAQTKLKDGLRETIEWWINANNHNDQ